MAERFQAIVIGNSTFPDLPELRCPLNDARGMAELLQSEEHGPYEVSVLENQSHDKIYREIFRALSRASRNDRVLIYYAGHGKVDERDSNLYLAASNTLVEELPASSVAVADILRHMSHSASKQLILILDCCYSGAVDRLLNASSLYRGAASDQIAENLRPAGGSGSYILTASTSLQRAEEREGDQHGLLTKHVIAGIREGRADRDDDGLVSMHELTLYVQDQVKAEGRQTPQCYTMREENGGLVIAKTGKVARSRKLAEVQEGIYERAAERRASLRTVRASLNLLVAEPWWSTEERASSDRFVDRLHGNLKDSHRFIEILEEAPTIVSGFSSGPRAAQLELERERDGLIEKLGAATKDRVQVAADRDALQERLAEAEGRVEAAGALAEELRAGSQKLADRVPVVETRLGEAESGRAAAETSLGVAKNEIGELREKERLLGKREKKLEAELGEERRSRVAAAKEVQGLQAELGEARRFGLAASKEMEGLKAGLAEAGRRIDEDSANTQAAERACVVLRTEVEQERQRGAELEQELKATRKSLTESAARLKTVEAKEKAARAELSEQLEDARRKLAAAETDLLPFKQQMKEVKAEADRKAEKAANEKHAGRKEEAILAVLRKYKDQSGYYVYPKIPADKNANARQRCGVAIDCKTLALVDCTVLGSAKDCVLFDTEKVYWHNLGDKGAMLYSNISTAADGMKPDGRYIVKAAGMNIHLAGSNFHPDKLIEMLKELYRAWTGSVEMGQVPSRKR